MCACVRVCVCTHSLQAARAALSVYETLAKYSYTRDDVDIGVTVAEWLSQHRPVDEEVVRARAAALAGGDAGDGGAVAQEGSDEGVVEAEAEAEADEATVDADGEWSV